MSEIRSQCEGCGACCQTVYLPFRHDEIVKNIKVMERNRNSNPVKYDKPIKELMDDKTFVIYHWYPVTKEEALKLNPHIESARSSFEENGWDFYTMLENNYYGCSFLNKETNRCNTHDNLPRVCSGYPWYGKRPSPNHLFLKDDCFYKNDITEEALARYDIEHSGIMADPECLPVSANIID